MIHVPKKVTNWCWGHGQGLDSGHYTSSKSDVDSFAVPIPYIFIPQEWRTPDVRPR